MEEIQGDTRGGGWVWGIGMGLVVAFGVVAGWGYGDGQRWGELEVVVEETAVGDVVLVAEKRDAFGGLVISVGWEGKRLVPVGEKVLKIKDVEVRRVGKDVASGVSIYREKGGVGEDYLLRVSGGRFLRVRVEENR
jgi:hypothetical protein